MDTLPIISIVSAVASAVAAFAAWRATSETRKATQAQLLARILDSYARPEFNTAIRKLTEWQEHHGVEFAVEFRRMKVNRDTYDQVAEFDDARRLLAHYFQKVWALHSLGYINESVVKRAVSEGQAEILQKYVDPLDWANNPSSFEANQAYVYLLGLYNLKRWSPPIA